MVICLKRGVDEGQLNGCMCVVTYYVLIGMNISPDKHTDRDACAYTTRVDHYANVQGHHDNDTQ